MSMKPPEQLADRDRTMPVWLQILLVLVVGIACYANSLLVPLQFDDDPTLHVVAVEALSGSRSTMDILTSPRGVAVLTFALNLKLHGERVLGFHLFNLMVHLSAALFVLGLLRRMFAAAGSTFSVDSRDERFNFLGAHVPFAAALLFVSHPIQTQAVTYISQRYTSLAACLYLAALYAFFRARFGNADRYGCRWCWGACAILCAVLAMNSKEIAFTLPAMIVLIEALLFRGRLLKQKVVLILGGLLLIVPIQVMVANRESGLMQALQRATSETLSISRHDYLLTQLRVIITYIRLLLFPVGQNLDYDYPLYRTISDPQVLAALALHLTVVVVTVTLVLLSRPGRRLADNGTMAVQRLCAVGICWFYLALSVESSIIPIRDYIFEHRLYLPSVGFFLAMTTALVYPFATRPRLHRPYYLFLVVVCCLLSTATVARNHVWRSEMSLWQDTLAKSPGKARPHHSVGKLHYMRWKPELAMPYLLRAIEIDPGKPLYRITLNHCVGLVTKSCRPFRLTESSTRKAATMWTSAT